MRKTVVFDLDEEILKVLSDDAEARGLLVEGPCIITTLCIISQAVVLKVMGGYRQTKRLCLLTPE